MDARAQPENTVKNNRWAMTRLKGWLQKRQINVDLKHASGEDLAPILRRFCGEVKSTGGKVLTPSSLVGLRAGIQMALINLNCLLSPMQYKSSDNCACLFKDNYGIMNNTCVQIFRSPKYQAPFIPKHVPKSIPFNKDTL